MIGLLLPPQRSGGVNRQPLRDEESCRVESRLDGHGKSPVSGALVTSHHSLCQADHLDPFGSQARRLAVGVRLTRECDITADVVVGEQPRSMIGYQVSGLDILQLRPWLGAT